VARFFGLQAAAVRFLRCLPTQQANGMAKIKKLALLFVVSLKNRNFGKNKCGVLAISRAYINKVYRH
jgi:hypothetical protein